MLPPLRTRIAPRFVPVLHRYLPVPLDVLYLFARNEVCKSCVMALSGSCTSSHAPTEALRSLSFPLLSHKQPKNEVCFNCDAPFLISPSPPFFSLFAQCGSSWCLFERTRIKTRTYTCTQIVRAKRRCPIAVAAAAPSPPLHLCRDKSDG